MSITRLFDNNRHWRAHKTAQDPTFFSRLARGQAPAYLWIGCSDSRVPANDILGLEPGELFVHRNIANLVVADDANLSAVITYAVAALRVRDILVAGHYGCGGVRAALGGPSGLDAVDAWLRPVTDLHAANRAELDAITDPEARVDRLCELNVAQQVANVAAHPAVQAAWAEGRTLNLHGLIYGLADGQLRDLGCTRTGPAEAPRASAAQRG